MSAPYLSDGPIHTWFGLTYANYQVLHRSLMQSMPHEWQERMVACLDELRDAFGHLDTVSSWLCVARGNDGKFIQDPIPHYNRGRTRVPLRETA